MNLPNVHLSAGEANNIGAPSTNECSRVCKVGFLLTPSFSMLPFTSAIDVLHTSNVVSEKILYDCQSISENGAPVLASNGIEVNADISIDETDGLSMVIVCGSVDPSHYQYRKIIRWLRNLAALGIEICAVDTGSYILAKAGLLVRRQCAFPRQLAPLLKLEFPELNISDNLFESDSGRRTCAGGTAAIYMILDLIKENHGDRFVELVAEKLSIEEIRGSNHKQRKRSFVTVNTTNTQLTECIDLMEANIEEPLKLSDLTRLIGISRRQLERVFNYYLKYSPRSYYIEIRLLEGQRLIRQSDQKITEIALLCGFSNSGHFSTAYKRLFGHSPRCDRTCRSTLHGTNGNQLGTCAA